MKLALSLLGAFAVVQLAAPAMADPRVDSHTSVTQVHGPMKVLPHHKRKYCKWVRQGHKRVKKCWYH